MPRQTLPVTAISKVGVAPPVEVTGVPADNHLLPNDGRTFLLVRNANGAAVARTLTVRLQGSIDGQAIAPKTYSIPAAASRYIGPFDTTRYGSNVQIDVDNAELRLIALRLP